MSPIPILSLAELHVLLDAATGSLTIKDGGALFRYDADARERVVNTIVARMKAVPLTVEPL